MRLSRPAPLVLAVALLAPGLARADEASENWTRIQGLVEKANKALNEGKPEDAIKTIAEIVERAEKPTGQPAESVKHLRATCYFVRAKCCVALKKTTAALINFERYCELEPDLDLIENDKGLDPLRGEERFQQAVAKLKKRAPAPATPAAGPAEDPAAAENTKAIQEHANRIDAAYAESRFQDVVNEAKVLFELSEKPSLIPAENVRVLRAICWRLVAGAFAANKKTDPALDATEKSLALQPEAWSAFEKDKNFDPVRDEARFKAALEKAKTATGGPKKPAATGEAAAANRKKVGERLQEAVAALKEKRFEDAIRCEEEVLSLLEEGAGLTAAATRSTAATAHMIECICFASSGKKDEALDHFEKGVALGYRDLRIFEGDRGFDPIREDPRFRKVVAALREAFSLDDPRSKEIVEEELVLGALGGATANLRLHMSPKAYAGFKKRMSPLLGWEDVKGSKQPKLGPPSALSVLNSLEIATMPVELKKLSGDFDDASSSFAARYSILGLAKNQGGRWRLPLDDGDWEGDVKDGVVTLKTIGLVYGQVVERHLKLTLPDGATGIELEKRPNRLSYHLPAFAAPPPQGAGEPELRLQVKPYITTALYKLYGDPRFSRFWAAKTVFKNESKDALANFKVRFRLTDYSSWSPWERCDTVAPGQTVVDAFYPVIDAKVRELKAATPGVVEVEYEYERNGKKVSSGDSARLRLLGMNEALNHSGFAGFGAAQTWYERRSDTRELLASFVAGDDPVMHEVVGMLQHEIGGAWSNHSDKDAKRFLESLYNLICTNIAYEGARGLFESDETGQEYKYGRDVLRTKTGTCVNLSILFASVCEAAGFMPTIFLIEGHAFPGVRLPESGDMVFVETTLCAGGTPETAGGSFEDACRSAACTYSDALEKGLIIPVDILAARHQGIAPPELPDPGKNFLKQWDVKPPVAPKPGAAGPK